MKEEESPRKKMRKGKRTRTTWRASQKKNVFNYMGRKAEEGAL